MTRVSLRSEGTLGSVREPGGLTEPTQEKRGEIMRGFPTRPRGLVGSYSLCTWAQPCRSGMKITGKRKDCKGHLLVPYQPRFPDPSGQVTF